MVGFSSKFASRVLNSTIKVLNEDFTYLDKASDLTYPIKGIYNEDLEIVDPETEQIISSSEVGIDIKLSTLPVAPKQNDEITRTDNQKVYIVKDILDDGQGATCIIVFEKII